MSGSDFVACQGSLAGTISLRDEVLGWKQLTTGLDADIRSRHFLILSNAGDAIACGSCGPSPIPVEELASESAVRFYGVAVAPEFQSQGLGTRVLSALMTEAARQQATILWANARESAIPFYLARGFQTTGETFVDPLSGQTDSKVFLRLPATDSSRVRLP